MARARILIADDHAAIREQLAHLLAPEHDIVALVGDGKAAVAAAVQLAPDLVLLDISMPVMGGIIAARRLKKHSRAPKVVFITGHADAAYVDEAFRVGAEGYVLKSNLAAELGDAIRAVFAGRTYRSRQIPWSSNRP